MGTTDGLDIVQWERKVCEKKRMNFKCPYVHHMAPFPVHMSLKPHVLCYINRSSPYLTDNLHHHNIELVMSIDPQSLSRRPNKRQKTKATHGVTEGDDVLADGIIVKEILTETSDRLITKN